MPDYFYTIGICKLLQYIQRGLSFIPEQVWDKQNVPNLDHYMFAFIMRDYPRKYISCSYLLRGLYEVYEVQKQTFAGFIKTTDHRYQPTDPLTTYHLPNDRRPVIINSY